ncbi:MAG: glycosyltransferase, partial [Candidatus Obscuribacterales bacterium]|nr:glycosyltransferase [Candidatus Obscuribacterales bacterium]
MSSYAKLRIIWDARQIREKVKSAEIVHVCDHSNAVYVDQLKCIPHVVTCHDLLAVRSGLGEQTYCPLSPMGKLLQRWILRGLRRALTIACDSQATRQDAQRLLGEQWQNTIEKIWLGLNYPFRVLSREESLSRLAGLTFLNATQPYVLHIG